MIRVVLPLLVGLSYQGLLMAEEPKAPFVDVPKGHWARDAVDSLATRGLFPLGQRRFDGETPITRNQMALIVYRTSVELGGGSETGDPSLLGEQLRTMVAQREILQRRVQVLSGQVEDLRARVRRLAAEADSRQPTRRVRAWGQSGTP